MTTVDTLKFPVNRFIIAASSVWKYKQFPHLIIGRIWGSLTLPRQRIQCATARLCLVACVLSFLLFAFSRSPRLFPEIIKLIFPSKHTRELEERKWLQYKLFYFCRNGLKKKKEDGQLDKIILSPISLPGFSFPHLLLLLLLLLLVDGQK